MQEALLKEQLGKLEGEIAHIEHEFRLRFGIDPYSRLTPNTLMRMFDADLLQRQQLLRGFEDDLQAMQSMATLKPWLKQMRRLQREYEYDDMSF